MTSLTPGLAKSRGGFDDTDYRIWAIFRNRCRRFAAENRRRGSWRRRPRAAPGAQRHAQRPPEASRSVAALEVCAAGTRSVRRRLH